jgi:glycine/D-amino acid oxidase-like deaminating enzyme
VTDETPSQASVGERAQWENGYLATHFSGLGTMLSPAVGELLAELIATGRRLLRAAQMLAQLAPRS